MMSKISKIISVSEEFFCTFINYIDKPSIIKYYYKQTLLGIKNIVLFSLTVTLFAVRKATFC